MLILHQDLCISMHLIVFSIIGLLTYLDASGGGSVAFADATLEEQISSIVSSLLFAGLEFGLFGRILVQVLLAERNEIIAKNIPNLKGRIFRKLLIYNPITTTSVILRREAFEPFNESMLLF